MTTGLVKAPTSQSLNELKAQTLEAMLETLLPNPRAANNFWFETGYWQAREDIKDYIKQLRE